jgi:hypothetical protein
MMSFLPLALAATAGASQPCHEIHYLPDGTMQERWVDADTAAEDSGNGASAHSSSSGNGRSHSSVSVSSSSSGSRASSSSSSANGHSVSMTQDDKGCRIVIDDRDGSSTQRENEP